MRRVLAFLLVTVFFIVCLYGVALLSVMLVLGKQSEGYDETTGTVTKSEVEQVPCFGVAESWGYYSPRCAYLHVGYSYKVDEQPYSSERVSYMDPALHRFLLLPEALEEIARKYEVGDSVVVYYDAVNPHQSVIEQGYPAEYNYVAAGSVVLLLVAVSLLVRQFGVLVRGLDQPTYSAVGHA